MVLEDGDCGVSVNYVQLADIFSLLREKEMTSNLI